MKVENALPKSCTGIYAKESIFTAAAKAAMTTVPKLFTRPWTIRMPKFITDCWAQVRTENWDISRSTPLSIPMSLPATRNSGIFTYV